MIYRVIACGVSKCGNNFGIAVDDSLDGWIAERFRKVHADEQSGSIEDWREIIKHNTRKVSA